MMRDKSSCAQRQMANVDSEASDALAIGNATLINLAHNHTIGDGAGLVKICAPCWRAKRSDLSALILLIFRGAMARHLLRVIIISEEAAVFDGAIISDGLRLCL